MHTRRILATVASAATATVLVGTPALADSTADTTVTFTVNAGTLDITAPLSANLGAGAPGTDISDQLGTVEVTDTRASADASWVATVTSTDFTTGVTPTATETIAAELVDYWSGPATVGPTGTGTFTEGQTAAGDAEPLNDGVTPNVPVTAFTHTGGTGNNSVGWNPTLVVHVPLANEAGLYTGTVTHSVA